MFEARLPAAREAGAGWVEGGTGHTTPDLPKQLI